MRLQKKSLFPLLLLSAFLFYAVIGLVLWRLGFVKSDQSLMEKLVTIIFLLMFCLSPTAILSWVSTTRTAKKHAAAHDERKAAELRARSLKSLIRGVMDCVIGGLGYYLVSRRVFPQIDVIWIFSALYLPAAGVQLWFYRRLASIKEGNVSTDQPALRVHHGE